MVIIEPDQREEDGRRRQMATVRETATLANWRPPTIPKREEMPYDSFRDLISLASPST